jgi:iron complex outermembrane recepter protein
VEVEAGEVCPREKKNHMGARRRYSSTAIAKAVAATLRAASVCVPGMLAGPPVALAQSLERTQLSADIPAQSLAESLASFARQTGLQLVYESEAARNRKSGAASAGMSADEALVHILQGTGLQFEYLTPRTIRILVRKTRPIPATTSATPSYEEPLPLEQLLVTASRRMENVQDVPMSVQVLSADTLAKINATTFEDYVRYLPGVNAQGVGPGQNNIHIRGLSTPGAAFLQSSGTFGATPAVAVYLDEQSVTLFNRNADLYLADLDRIEILEGPQGTLFGAGSEAGVVRYITNRPQLNLTEASANAGLASTAHGSASNNIDVTVNIPLIADKLAIRAVLYHEHRGGYIDNLPATFARADTDLSIGYAGADGKVPANSVVINNYSRAGASINPVTYQGGRVAALYQFGETWTAQLTQSYQDMVADGVFTEMPTNTLGQQLPDLSVQLFNPSYDKDRFSNTAVTIEGQLDALQLLYAGSYLVRNVEQVQDYTAYARGGIYVDYYQCVNPGPTAATAQCFTPSSTWRDLERNTHVSQELRLRTPDDRRLRAVGGLFYERDTIQEQVDWFYESAYQYFNPIGPPTGYYSLNGSPLLATGGAVQPGTPGAVFVAAPPTLNNPNVRPPDEAFLYDVTRGYRQTAGYGSVDFDLTPSWTLTAGTRYFDIRTSEAGAGAGASGMRGCQLHYNPTAPNPCVNWAFSLNLNSVDLNPTFSGFTSRLGVRWRVTDDAELYFAWSQGLRVGGANRLNRTPGGSPLSPGQAQYQAPARAHGGWNPPLYFAPDRLTNTELGWKTTWLEGRMQWNGALYQENWTHVQSSYNDQTLLGGTFFINGGDYRVRGIESSVIAHMVRPLTITVAADWNQTALLAQAPFLWADGTPIDFSALRTSTGASVSSPNPPLGSPLAGAPPFQGNVRVRYDFLLGRCAAFAQLGAIYQAHSYASTDYRSRDLQGNSIAYYLPAFSSYDASTGISWRSWLLQAYGQNLTDSRAELNANYRQFYKGVTVSRPRTVGLHVNYNFASH